jgi:hypothetical protein
MACRICETLEILKVCGVKDALSSLTAERTAVIERGYATREEANTLCDLLRAGALLCRGERCDHGDGIDNRIPDVRQSLPERVPVSLYAGLFSDFDLVATSVGMNA